MINVVDVTKNVKCIYGLEQPLAQKCCGCGRYFITPLEEMERKAIVRAIVLAGKVALAARYLGVSKTLVYRKIHAYGLTVQEIQRGKR